VYGKVVTFNEHVLGGGAGVTKYLAIPCPVGYERHILWARVWHDDNAADRLIGWRYFSDNTYSVKVGIECEYNSNGASAEAAGVPIGWGAVGDWGTTAYTYLQNVRFVINDDFSIEAFGSAVAVDKYITFLGQAIEVPKNSDLMVLEKTTGAKWYPLRSRE